MKVIIIGAGLSGLSSAIALRKYLPGNIDIKIYDKPDDPSDISTPEDRETHRRRKLGAGLGLQSNGLRVLQDLDPELRDKVYAAGFPCTHFKWKTAGDVLLAREHVDVLPISRPFLIDCLLEALPEDIVEYKTVLHVAMSEHEKPVVHFADGSAECVADLVIGADGVGSVVRKALFDDNDEQYKPMYLGICGVGGVLDQSLPQHLIDDPSMVFFMGQTGVFGYSGLTQKDKNKLLYWSIYETDLPPRGQKFNQNILLEQLRERHGKWEDPLIGKCLAKAELDNIYPTFVMPMLPRWGQNGCVLVGDAAHSLPPRSGQGASQAFEDAQTLALLLASLTPTHESSEAVEKAIADFYQVRHARVAKIRASAIAWKDPKMPMPMWQAYLLFVFVSVFALVRNVMSYFEKIDSWDAKVEIKRLLDTRAGSQCN